MKNSKNTFQFIWGAFMAIAYLGISYLILFTPILLPYNSGNNNPSDDQNLIVRIFLGVVLCAYGLFRGYRIWKSGK